MPKSSDAAYVIHDDMSLDSTCPHCGCIFNGPQGVRVHISRQHQAISQAMKLERRANSTRGCASVPVQAIASAPDPVQASVTRGAKAAAATTSSQDKSNKFLSKWTQNFHPLVDSDFLDTDLFDQLCEEFSADLLKEQSDLPGPKHPAARFYQKRKQGRHPERGKGYRKCTNPVRATKQRTKASRENYEYDLTQYEYYNRKKKAWQRVHKPNDTRCTIPTKDVEDHFRSCICVANTSTRKAYEPVPREPGNSVVLTSQDIEDSMKGIDPGTAPGMDKVLLRPLKALKCSPIIATIGSLMLRFSYVPKLYRQGRTILIHKGGDVKNMSNFRPITIFPIIRRVIERALDRKVRASVNFCSAQRGFVSVPGTYINTSIVNSVLQSAKNHKKDAVVAFLDVSKAFDNVGHKHLASAINSQPLPSDLKRLLIQLATSNTIQVEVNSEKTSRIPVHRGVPQGAPLSPTLFNLAIDFLIKEMVEEPILKTYGYEVSELAGIVCCIAFADDIAILAKDMKSAIALIELAIRRLREIGLEINLRKSLAINIEAGKLVHKENFSIDLNAEGPWVVIPTLNHGERIRYLGIDFYDEIVLDKVVILKTLTSTLEELVRTPLLKPDQKLNMINQFVWPTLIYPLQCAPLKQLTNEFLKDVDIAIRGSVKEILQIPMDTPDSMIYSPRKFRGLGVVKAAWEAFLQHINICGKLASLHDIFIDATRNISGEIAECLDRLSLNSESVDHPQAKHLRTQLRSRAYDFWCSMPVKGQGVVQYQENPPTNKWIINKEGLSSNQWTNAIKMTTNCAAVRGLKGRSGEATSCRHTSVCKKTETLSHVLQDCSQGDLLRTIRHHKIRDFLEEKLKEQGLTVYHEVRCTDVEGRERRADLVVIDNFGITSDNLNPGQRAKGYILDPTVRFETTASQALDVDREKKEIYEPTIPFFQRSYNIVDWEVLGLYVGARGTITNFLRTNLQRFHLRKSVLQEICSSVLRDSLGILHHHLFSKTR